IVFTAMALGTGVLPQQAVKPLPAPASRQVDFVKDIQPIFVTSCVVCHGSTAQRSNLRLDSKAALLKGGLSGPAIIPWKRADSLLVRLVFGVEGDRFMPLGGPRLADEQIGLLRAWIDQGATWPEEAAQSSVETKHWSYRKPIRPELPVVHETSWPRNSIDY